MPGLDLSIARSSAGLPDPRVARTKKCLSGGVLVIAMRAVITGLARAYLGRTPGRTTRTRSGARRRTH